MSEHDLLKSLRQLNGPVEPDESFRKQLRHTLLVERGRHVVPGPGRLTESSREVQPLELRGLAEPGPSTTRNRLAVAFAAFLAVVLVGAVAFWLAPGPEDELPPVSSPELPSTSLGSTPSTLGEDDTARTTITFPPREGEVTVLPGAADLEGPVALLVASISPSDGEQSLWVLQPGGQKLQRSDIPDTRDAIFLNQMTIVGDYLLLPVDGIYKIDLDLQEPAKKIDDGQFIMYPDLTRDRVWMWRGDWFAPFDVNAGTLGPRTEVHSGPDAGSRVGHPIFAHDDGLVFLQDSDSSGDFVYWPSGADGPEPFPSSWNLYAGPWAVSGDVAAIVSRSGELALVDLRTGERSTPFQARPSLKGLCFSPDGDRLVVVFKTGTLVFFDTRTGERMEQVHPGSDVQALTMGWVSADQLVYIRDEEYFRDQLVMFDLKTGSTTAIANLQAPSRWITGTLEPRCG